MNQHHRVSFEEYETSLENQMKVEQKREQEYKKSKKIVSEIDSQLRK